MPFKSTYRKKSIFLTGHTGFKGSWLAEWLLLLDAKVTGYALDPPTSPSHFELTGLGNRLANDIRGDIRDLTATRNAILQCQPDFIFHLAAQPIVRTAFEDPYTTIMTNCVGTLNILEALRTLKKDCIVIMITTDKVYENNEWIYAYREADPLGGIDPYSASKACAETVISSYFRSFFFLNLIKKQHPRIAVSSVRAGNVIGGGDWAKDRIVPDCIRSMENKQKIPVRNGTSTRPWQHVLEPLGGYLLLGATISHAMNSDITSSDNRLKTLCSPFNFGPQLSSNRTVLELVRTITQNWNESKSENLWEDKSDPNAPHEAGKLNLAIDKAHHILNWNPQWDFNKTIAETVQWYKNAIMCSYNGDRILEMTVKQIQSYASGIGNNLM